MGRHLPSQKFTGRSLVKPSKSPAERNFALKTLEKIGREKRSRVRQRSHYPV
ncbi:MAG: hypothetical protein AAFX40_10765 [Cyanobacteria bacterium J06639_1]